MFSPDFDNIYRDYSDTNVYSSGIKFATIYFNGNPPSFSSQQGGGRSLSRDIAMMMTDYFEVVFVYNSGSNEITRANWEIGELARVQRPSPGNYASVSLPSVGEGSALLFAGRKFDKTLLALGRICEVDNLPGTTITADTNSVTFEVVALKAGLSVEELSSGVPLHSGFLTSARAGTPNTFSDVTRENTIFAPNFPVDSLTFPAFKFENWDSSKNPIINPVFHGQYTFSLDTSSSIQLLDYQNSIILAANGMVERRDVPRYVTNPADSFILDNKTVVTMENNKTGFTQTFQNPVLFKFDLTGTEQGSVFSLVFQIPVYALTDQENPVLWYIRPAFGSDLYKLDDGKGGQGGAILFSTGNVDPYFDTTDYDFDVVKPPSKWQYGSVDGWNFVVNDIELVLTPVGYPQHAMPVQWDDPNVRYTLGNGSLILTPGSSNIPNELFGLIPVSVQYILQGRAYTGNFYIWCVGSSAVDLKRGSPTIVNVTNIGSVPTNYSNGTYIWLLQNTVNVNSTPWIYVNATGSGWPPPPENVFILVMAAGDGFSLERNAVQRFYFLSNAVSNNLIMYFGGWPFPDDSADPVVINTLKPLRNAKKYTINAANTGTINTPIGGLPTLPLGSTSLNDGYMIEMYSTPTPNIRVHINPNMEIYNEAFFAEGHVVGSR